MAEINVGQLRDILQGLKVRAETAVIDLGEAQEMLSAEPLKPAEPIEPGKRPKPGENGRKVVEKLEWTGSKKTKLTANTDYTDARFFKIDIVELDDKNLPTGVRFFNAVFDGISGAKHTLYINMGLRENEIDFRAYDTRFVRCRAGNIIEIKGSLFTWDGIEEENCETAQIYRGRLGRKHTVLGYTGKNEIAVRGWANFVDASPQARAIAWAGNLPAKYEDWFPRFRPGGGFNMMSTSDSYFGKLGSIEIGHLGQPDYPALDCYVDPDMEGKTKLSRQKGTQFRKIANPKELWKLAGLK